MTPNSRRCVSIDPGAHPRVLSFYLAMMSLHTRCSHCQMGHSVQLLAVKQLLRVIINERRYEGYLLTQEFTDRR